LYFIFLYFVALLSLVWLLLIILYLKWLRMLSLISLCLFPYDEAKTYNFLPLTIKQGDGGARLKEIYPEYDTIFLIVSIDVLISLFCRVLHFLHLVLPFFCFYIL